MTASQQSPEAVSTRAILQFFLPLAATSVLMMASHSLATSAMVKTSDPALALASFSVAQSLGMMFEGAVTVSRQFGMARIKDYQTWTVITRLMLMVVAALFGIMSLVAFTPLGVIVFSRLMGAPLDVAGEAVKVFRLFLIFPAESCLRFTYHGLIILRKKTVYTTVAMAGRISVMITASFLMMRNPPALGGAAGAVVILSGIGTEAIVSFLAGRSLVKTLDRTARATTAGALSMGEAFRFYLPLAASAVIASFSRVALSAGLSRTTDPKVALAAYQVSWTLVWVFISPVTTLHQVTVVFGRAADGFRKVRSFALGLGGCAAAALALFTVSGAARHVLSHWIGVSEGLVTPALWAIGLMAVLPFFTLWSELFTGRLLVAGDSVSIGSGRTIYVIVLSVAALSLAVLLPGLGAIVAPLAIVAGTAAEALFLWRRARAAADSSIKSLMSLPQRPRRQESGPAI